MADVKLIIAEDGYRLECGDESSELMDFGEPLEWEVGGSKYLAFVDLPDGGDESAENVESLLDHWVYKVSPLDVEPEDEEEDDDGGGSEGADDADTVIQASGPDGQDEEEDDEEDEDEDEQEGII